MTKYYSTVNPKYYVEVNNNQVNTDLLQTALANSNKATTKYFSNPEDENEFINKINRYIKNATQAVHPYILWLQYAMQIVSRIKVKSDMALPDRGYWQGHTFKNIITTQDRKKTADFVLVTNPSEFPKNYTVLDVETTGLNPDLDSIIQLSMVKYQDDKEINRMNLYLTPSNHQKLSQNIIDITKITDDKLDGAPEFKEILSEFKKFVGNDIIIGHNVTFDLKMLRGEYKRINEPFTSIRYIDTLKLARTLMPYKPRGGYKLENLKYDLPDSKLGKLRSHDSLNDVLITGALYQYLRDEKM